MVLCVCLKHVALSTDVDGEIRLYAVSPRLANAKPLLSSVLDFVDYGRVGRLWPGFFLALGQFVSPPRRLAPLRCLAPRGSFPPAW